MTVNTYDVGDKVTITGTFTNGGVAADPAAVRAKYRNGTGTVTTLVYGTDAALTKSGTGVYVFSISITAEGTWYYRMDDNNTNVATEGQFKARESSL